MKLNKSISETETASRPVILLCGMPRSGTTWVGKIFDSHPDVIYRHEPDTLMPISGVPLLASPDNLEQYRPAVEAFCETIAKIQRTKVSATIPVFMKSYQPWSGWVLRRASIGVSRYLGRVLGEMPVLEGLNYRSIPHAPMVWKSIESTGRFGLLARTIPQSRCILVLRHPCGHIASVLRGEARGKFASDRVSSEDLGVFELLAATPQAKRNALDLRAFKQMKPVERLAWRWAIFNEKALEETEDLPNITVLRYEDLCARPVEVARQLFAFAGLSWTEQAEQFLRASTTRERGSYYSVFKDPLRAANKWRQELDQVLIDQIMGVVARTRAGVYYLPQMTF
jgi:hypothetical protein